MADDPGSPNREQTGANLDFDKIKAELASLDSEIREDESERLGAPAVIKGLEYDELRLSEILRRWRFQPTEVDWPDLDTASRLLYAIYEALEDDLPRLSPLWAVYRPFREDVEDGYIRAMDALSVFREVTDIYGRQDLLGRPLDQVGNDLAAVSASRRTMIQAVRHFSEMIRPLVRRLAARAGSQ